ncbi:MAG: cohesin domain-containing protein [Acutalibacteraceae bacterium]
MKKRVLSVFLAFAVLICMFGGLSLYGFAANTNPVSDEGFVLYNPDTDADTLTVALDDVSGAVGDIIDFSATIRNNTGIFNAAMSIKYDSDVLSPVVVNMGTDTVVSTKAGTVLSSATPGVEKDAVDVTGNSLGYKIIPFILENTAIKDSTNNGVLFTIKFEIIAKPSYGDTTNVVFADYDDTMFISLENVLEPVFEEGSVTVVDNVTTAAPVTTENTTTLANITTTEKTTTPNTTTIENTTTTENITTTENNTTTEVTEPDYYKTNPVSDEDFVLYNPDTDADKLTIALDDVQGAVGGTVDFSAEIKNNSGLFTANISLKYDSDVLRPILIDNGQELITDSVAGDVLPTVISGPVSEVTDDNDNKLGYQVISFILENTGMANTTKNGILLTVKFEIIAKPTYGDTTSVVFTDCDNTMFASLDGIVLQPVYDEGSVTVLDEVPTTEPPTTTLAPTTATPTTLAPKTTVAPTTLAPKTTAAPTTLTPKTTAAPTTLSPKTTAAPTTLSSKTTAAPTTLSPKTTAAPTVSVPTTKSQPTTVLATESIGKPTTTQSITADIIYGDANDDGRVDMLDVLLLRKYIAKQPVKPNLTASEVNCDNSIDMRDVLLIRKYIAKQPVTLGPKI